MWICCMSREWLSEFHLYSYSWCITTLSRLSLILSWWKFVRMSMLSKQDHSRSRVTASTREISGLCSLLVRVVGYKVDKLLNLRLARKLRAIMWSITRWEGWEWIRRYSGPLGGIPRLCRLRTASCWALWNKHWTVLTHAEFMVSRKPNSFCNWLVKM
jgi:hypothetical protein